MANKKTKSRTKIAVGLGESIRVSIAGSKPDDIREALVLLQNELAMRQVMPIYGVIVKNTGPGTLKVECSPDVFSITKGNSHVVVPDFAGQPDGLTDVTRLFENLQGESTDKTKKSSTPDLDSPSKDPTNRPDSPVKPARVMSFDILNTSTKSATAEIDTSAVDPRRQNGMTVVLKYIGQDTPAGFQEVPGLTKVEIRPKGRIRVIGMGFDVVFNTPSILGRNKDG